MDPITRACSEYDQYLREGGEPVNLKEMGFDVCSERKRARKLHPSSLGPGLCSRKACYNVMADVGEIEKDVPDDPQGNLGHRVGYIFEDFVSQALAWKGALVNLQPQVENDNWIGRPDQIVDPTKLLTAVYPFQKQWEGLWLLDCKTVKGYSLYNRYPKVYHMSQVDQYVSMMDPGLRLTPVLYYITRIDFTTALYTWSKDERLYYDIPDFTATIHNWETGIESHNDIYYYERDVCLSAQERWLTHGTLPDRCGVTPTQHSFMCANYNKGGPNKGRYTVGCQFFGQCWGTLPTGLVFDKAEFEEEDYLPF